MSGHRQLSAQEVEVLRDELGRDLRTVDAAARRARESERERAVASHATVKPEVPSHRLPPVGHKPDVPAPGRHTDVLEHINPYSEASRKPVEEAAIFLPEGPTHTRRPSLEAAPIKKPKLEPPDVVMHRDAQQTGEPHPLHISPGEPIPSTTQEDDSERDVEIPELEQANSPSFASQAQEVPPQKNLPGT